MNYILKSIKILEKGWYYGILSLHLIILKDKKRLKYGNYKKIDSRGL
jgi:hypothetical protein